MSKPRRGGGVKYSAGNVTNYQSSAGDVTILIIAPAIAPDCAALHPGSYAIARFAGWIAASAKLYGFFFGAGWSAMYLAASLAA